MERLQITNTATSELMINRPLVEVFSEELIKNGMNLSIAEGVSGGSLIDAITIPGATRIIHMGGIFYSTQSKVDLGVSPKTIEHFGEYSPNTAVEMANAMMAMSGSTLSIATVGQFDGNTNDQQRYFSAAYACCGRESWVKTIILPNEFKHRRLVKTEIAQSIFSHALHYLRNDKNSFNSDQLGLMFVTNDPINYELGIVDNLAKKLIFSAKSKDLTIATNESCTAGAIANALTNISGSSQVFDRGWLAYDENVKAKLGVPLKIMVNGNVYSLKVAQAMAEAVQKSSQAGIVIATTGTMDTIDTRPFHSDTPPGTVYVAVLIEGFKPFLKKVVIPCSLHKTREQLKVETVAEVLMFTNFLLDNLQKFQQERISLKVNEFGISSVSC